MPGAERSVILGGLRPLLALIYARFGVCVGRKTGHFGREKKGLVFGLNRAASELHPSFFGADCLETEWDHICFFVNEKARTAVHTR